MRNSAGNSDIFKMSGLERTFLTLCRTFQLPDPVREHVFHPVRKWRLDFAWPAQKVAVECEGGIWMRGRHVRGAGYSNDCKKYNAAQALGWRVFRLTTDMAQENPGEFMDQVKDALK